MNATNSSLRTILADRHIVELSDFLDASDIRLLTYDPHQWTPSEYHNRVDALLIRTVTPVDEQLINALGSRLAFIGTATSGTDHIDFNAVAHHDIQIAHARGCNAQAVAEYVLTGLIDWSERCRKLLSSLTIGIAGVGHVGTQVARLCSEIGIATRLYDPPRHDDPDNAFTSCSESELLACDVITLHTPLTTATFSDYPTYQWLDAERLRSGTAALWINAARGGIIDDRAMASLLTDKPRISAMIDCWQDEPEINEQLLHRADYATPHIAGYSVESKRNATRLISEQVRNALDLSPLRSSTHHSIPKRSIRKDIKAYSGAELLNQHGLKRYERALRKVSGIDRAHTFRRLRTNIPLRSEFGW